MKGYKVFNPDWTCLNFQYEVGKVYEYNGEIELCSRGFHFCEKANDCFNYYGFDPANRVAEVEAIGEIITKRRKSVTNKIRILRELTWEEVLEIVNIGKANAGRMNIGNHNTGNGDVGNGNVGDHNIGSCNTGDGNTGYYNIGNRNMGDYNTGGGNTGHYNTGDRNTGDWNKTNHSSGCFNTEVQKIKMFDKESDWTLLDWKNSDAKYVLPDLKPTEWVASSNMTDEEKIENPSHSTTGGFLRKLDTSKIATDWWKNLSEKNRSIIRALPNYDEKKFFDILGIVEEGK